MSVLVLVALGVAAIGLVDDLRGGIPFQVRLGAQAVGAVIAVAALGAGTLALPWAALLTVGGVIGIIGYVNAFNFMDGINGISGASAAVAGVMFAVIGRLETLPVIEAGGMALAAACLGFLPFNIPTARAFLGDVGSYFIGAWIAVLAYLAARAGVRLDVILAPLALYLADVGCTLAARVLRGDQWHAAHRDHTYQRLTASCDGHMRTTLFVLVVNTSLAGLGLVSLRAPGWRPLAWLGMALLLGVYLLSPSLIRRNRRPEPVVGPFGGAAQPSDPAPRGPL